MSSKFRLKYFSVILTVILSFGFVFQNTYYVKAEEALSESAEEETIYADPQIAEPLFSNEGYTDFTGDENISMPCEYYNEAVEFMKEAYAAEEQIFVESAEADLSESASGTIGENQTWILTNDGILTISGTGEMPDYSSDERPEWESSGISISSLVLEEGITSVGSLAFYNQISLSSVQLPSTLTAVREAAFYCCYCLPEVTLPDQVTVLETAAFGNCSCLENLSGGEGLQEIGDYAFQNTPLTGFNIGSSLSSLSGLAFFGCDSLSEFTGGNDIYQVTEGVIFSDNGQTLYKCPPAKTGEFIIPSGVTAVADQAFISCAALNAVQIADTVVSLGSSAFQGCTGLTEVAIPDSVTSADYFAFYGCSSLRKIVFGNGLKTLSYMMFEGCSALSEIDFGGVQEIDNRAFRYCYSLKELTLPETITSVGAAAFMGCTGLEVLYYNASTNYVPSAGFSGCTGLREIHLCEGIKYIYTQAFYENESLATAVLPSTLLHCYTDAFPSYTVLTLPHEGYTSYGVNGYVLTDKFQVTGTEDFAESYAVLDLVNQERSAEGLAPLYMDEDLLKAAEQRSAEQAVLFSHTRPDSTNCFNACSKMQGENIAAGQTDAESVMDSWMNSEGHRANILTADYTSIGIGCFKHNGMTYWVQCFGKNDISSNCAQPSNEEKTYTIELFCEDFTEYVAPGSFVFSPLEEYVFDFYIKLGADSIAVGNTTEADLYVRNGNWTYASAKLDSAVWQTENAETAGIDTEGIVTGYSEGTTSIYASLAYRGPVFKEITVTEREPVYTESITLNQSFAEIPTESTYQLQAEVYPEDADNKNIIWSSSNEEVAVVDENGLVTALTYGKAVITAQTEDSGVTADCQIQTRFRDVTNHSSGFFTPVYWAADNGITTGHGKVWFGTGEPCTRGQMVMFLWKMNGSPKVSGTLTFKDIAAGKKSNTYQSILWAVQKGYVKGYSNGNFGYNDTITRLQFVMILYKAAKDAGLPTSAQVKNYENVTFPDVLKKYSSETLTHKVVQWAVNEGITTGQSDGNFGIKNLCTRGQTVIFLYRFNRYMS